MLTYLYINKPQVLLIDEPDAHLHSKLQSRLGELFQKVAKDLNAQVFLSTHSLDLIDTFSTEEVIVVDTTKNILAPIGKNAELVSALIDADIIDVSALSRLLSSRKLIVVEDKDQAVLKAIDKACGSPLYSSKSESYVMSAKGVSNFRAIADLGKVISGLTQSKFDITFVQDRDGMPDFMVESFISSQNNSGIKAFLLERHEIENYLLEPKLMVNAAHNSGITIEESDAVSAIKEAAKNIKAEARQASMNCATLVNRHLEPKKRKDGELEVEVHKWFDDLDTSSLATIQKVFPGKELLPKALELLNKKFNGRITRGNLLMAIDETLIAKDIIEFLKRNSTG